MKGIFQGDSPSVLLFILSLNPMSFLLNKLKRYAFGKNENRNQDITHLFFVDDLNLFATNMSSAKTLLDLVTTFSQDIGMKFGESKCAYLMIERGKQKCTTEKLEMNGTKIQSIKKDVTYKYLGVDENVSYNGSLNKDRIQSEYLKRVRKLWRSELSGYNTYIAQNAFALPVLTPTFGILDWTKDEIKNIDIKTSKNLNMTGNLHCNADVDRLYASRKEGGRGLKMVKEAYESRIISINQHLHQSIQRNPYLKKVVQKENECIVRQAEEFLSVANITVEENCKPQKLSKKYLQYCKKERSQRFEEKICIVIFGKRYHHKKVQILQKQHRGRRTSI